eukprot:1051407-Prorocentrum_minimum.AAC.2
MSDHTDNASHTDNTSESFLSLSSDALREVLLRCEDVRSLFCLSATCRALRRALSEEELGSDVWTIIAVNSFPALGVEEHRARFESSGRTIREVTIEAGNAQALLGLLRKHNSHPARNQGALPLPATARYVLSIMLPPKVKPFTLESSMRKVFMEAPMVETPLDYVALVASALAWGSTPLGCAKSDRARRRTMEKTETKIGGINLQRAMLGSFWLGVELMHAIRFMALAFVHGDEEVRSSCNWHVLPT